MKTIYETEDGKTFTNEVMAAKWESLKRNTITRSYEYSVISPDQLKEIFELGEIELMTIVYYDSKNDKIIEDSNYEIFRLDDTEHLDCSDYNHGLFDWSEKKQSYFRTYHGNSWKVELLGIKDVHYW